ncbi:MAG: integrase core domain-containing protein [Chloroflexota bacterium]|nr:integrase core domain-containing protein [Chloroflexota bacterium]
MEAFHSRFKSENHSLFWEAPDLRALRTVARQRFDYYNTQRRHSALSYVAPLTFIQQHRSSA